MSGDETYQSVLALDGAHDLVRVADCPELQVTTYTVELWCKIPGPPPKSHSGWWAVLGKPGRGHSIFVSQSGTLHHRFHTSKSTNAGAPDTPAGSIKWGCWQHLAITNDGARARTYIDGELMAEGAVDGTLLADPTTFVLGANPDKGGVANGTSLRAEVAELRIFSRARDQEAICATMNRQLSGDEEGLVLYWPLSDGTARDLSPHGLHGECVGEPQKVFDPSLPVDDHRLDLEHPVLHFDGAAAYLEGGALPELMDAVTLEAWTRCEAAPNARGTLFRAFDEAFRLVLNAYLPWQGKVYWHAGSGKTDVLEQPVSADEYRELWTHWAFVKDCRNGEMTVLRNGAPWASISGKNRAIEGHIARIAVGAVITSDQGASLFWGGDLCDLRVWSVARSPEQIQTTMHHRLKGDEEGLVAYWPLDEEEGEVALDQSGNGHDLQIVGAQRRFGPVPLIEPEREAGSDSGATGLSDYAYWWHWKEHLAQEEVEEGVVYRRGRIAH